MGDFNTILLVPAAIAVLLFVMLVVALARRTRGHGLETPDARPAPAPAGDAGIAVANPPVERPAFSTWRLTERILANAASAGGPLYRLRFKAEAPIPRWQAGAVAHVYCAPAANLLPDTAHDGPTGDYMIGSLPEDDALDLVVRLIPSQRPENGRRSRWLCEELQIGEQAAIALRDDPDFSPPPAELPLILIGNATGIAGLQAHIKARPVGSRNWLIFGDRNSAEDEELAQEITGWVSSGHLERCDLVLPGEGQEQRRVTDQITDASAPLLDWALAGCAIYVCGSQRMGDDVDATLSRLLGDDVLIAMREAGLYRRSVY